MVVGNWLLVLKCDFGFSNWLLAWDAWKACAEWFVYTAENKNKNNNESDMCCRSRLEVGLAYAARKKGRTINVLIFSLL